MQSQKFKKNKKYPYENRSHFSDISYFSGFSVLNLKNSRIDVIANGFSANNLFRVTN